MDSVGAATCASTSIDQQFAEVVKCCDFSEVARSAKRSQTGKRLPGALYVHVSALSDLERSLQDTRKGSLQDYENLACQHLKKLEGLPSSSSARTSPGFPTCLTLILIPMPTLLCNGVFRLPGNFAGGCAELQRHR